MPSEPVPLFVVIRPAGRAPFRSVAIDDLTAILRIHRERMTVTRDDLKKKRLAAMGVVGAQTQASADMFDRVIAAGTVVAKARDLAEAAHVGALSEQMADLKEMADELEAFGQAAPPLSGTGKPAPVSTAPVTGSAALAALNSAAPSSLSADAWAKGNAFEGTHPDTPVLEQKT